MLLGRAIWDLGLKLLMSRCGCGGGGGGGGGGVVVIVVVRLRHCGELSWAEPLLSLVIPCYSEVSRSRSNLVIFSPDGFGERERRMPKGRPIVTTRLGIL